jgi:integrase
MHPLTFEQVNQLLTSVKDDRLFSAVFLELGTGLQRGEILALRWSDLDLDAEVLHVRQTLVRVKNHDATDGERKTRLIIQEPKTDHSRRAIPIPADIIDALRKAQNAAGARKTALRGGIRGSRNDLLPAYGPTNRSQELHSVF